MPLESGKQSFEVVYSADGAEAQWLRSGAVVVVAVTLLAATVLYRARGAKKWFMLAAVGVIGALLATIVMFRETVDDELSRAAASGRCALHSGTVTVLQREASGGHGPRERIRVDGAEFEFSNFSAGRHYHRTLAHGGVLRDGAHVRLCAVDGQIVRVEVAR